MQKRLAAAAEGGSFRKWKRPPCYFPPPSLGPSAAGFLIIHRVEVFHPARLIFVYVCRRRRGRCAPIFNSVPPTGAERWDERMWQQADNMAESYVPLTSPFSFWYFFEKSCPLPFSELLQSTEYTTVLNPCTMDVKIFSFPLSPVLWQYWTSSLQSVLPITSGCG